MSIKVNKKFVENKLEELNELTGYNFELHHIGDYYVIKDWTKSPIRFRSKNLDHLGDNLNDFIELHKIALTKHHNQINDLINEGIEE